MNCPVCKTMNLTPSEIENKLYASFCKSCEGHWLSSDKYFAWLTFHGESLPVKPFSEVEYEVGDVDKAKICPTCDRILLKYQVGHGINFHLDHCSSCNGVWLDKNEWNVLKERNLHDELHRIFTTSWQNEIKQEAKKQYYEKYYTEEFGTSEFEEIKKIKGWIDGHPKRASILAFLKDKDPYK